MANTGQLEVTTPTEREIMMTRVFDGPRDLRVGGTLRYVWRHRDGQEMGMRGVYREIVPPERLVATESFDESWYPGEALGTFALVEQGGKTMLTQTILYESREARDAVLQSPMESGVAAGYDRLAALLESLRAGDESQDVA